MSAAICRHSRAEDVPRLKELWRICFGDEWAYIDHCFANWYRPERVCVREDRGTVVSMLFTFPNELQMGTQTCRASYVYAFCTDPAARGRGHGRALLAYAEQCAAREGCAAVTMVPEEGSLYEFYGTLGYRTAFFHRKITVARASEGETFPFRPCGTGVYAARREALLAGRPHVSYPKEVLAYQQSLCRRNGGDLFAWEDGVAAVERDGDKLICKELLTPAPERAAAALLECLGARCAQVRLPAWEGTAERFGVIRWLDAGAGRVLGRGYLAFAFD